MYIVEPDKYIMHYGTPRHSGRYPYGSGKSPYQHTGDFIAVVDRIKEETGFTTEKEIATALGMSIKEYRQAKSNAKHERNLLDAERARKLYSETGNYSEVGRIMGRNESQIRAMLKDDYKSKNEGSVTTAKTLKEALKTQKYIDIGPGVAEQMGISDYKLKNAVALLKKEGYEVHPLQVDQLTTAEGKKTTISVLTKPDVKTADIYKDLNSVGLVNHYVEQSDGTTKLGLKPITNINSKRIQVCYNEDGGIDKDGVIEIRRGVEDLSLGDSKYAQVRIGVDGTHYLKGMAMYRDDMPDGIDIIFNTNKHRGTPMLGPKDNSVLKPQKDEDNPFGATVRQKEYIGSDGKSHISALNIVNEEGEWDKWSKTLSSQFLSKQDPILAKKQLDISYNSKKAEFDEINSLTNPVVKKHLMEKFADSCDSDAVHLKAAALPRQASKVILPFPDMKENQIYAPNLNNGETVVLIRYPHGGKFEIPTLVVNNKNRSAEKTIKNATDAVGINPKVAARLSGADFDGDTVLVIPVKDAKGREIVKINTQAPLEGLKDFEPKEAYPAVDGMKVMTPRNTQLEMGKISNLITDMTLAGAKEEHLERAVKHSMVVIDAEKHKLNYTKSYSDNNIAELKKIYQGGPQKGAATLISKSKSDLRVPYRKEITNTKEMTDKELADWNAGKKVYRETGETYTKIQKITEPSKMTADEYKRYLKGEPIWRDTGKEITRTIKSTKMAETDDANSLISKVKPTVMEKTYADYANKMKALGNEARRVQRTTEEPARSPAATRAYSTEVESLNAKLNIAMKNKPLERQALIIGTEIANAKIKDNPGMDSDEKRRVKAQAMTAARQRVGKFTNTSDHKSYKIDITDKEWEAIQSGAISKTKLKSILNNTNLDRVKELATPRETRGLSASKLSYARSLLNGNYTQAEVAKMLGVSVSTLNKALRS